MSLNPDRKPSRAASATCARDPAGTWVSAWSRFPEETASTRPRERSAPKPVSSCTFEEPAPRKIAPQTATPTDTPTWRNVSLMPDAMPLCSFGTTLTATSAITGLSRPMPAPATMKPPRSPVHSSAMPTPAISRRPPPAHLRQQGARDRCHQEHRHRQRQVAEPRLRRAVPEEVLEVERQVQEQGEHRARDPEGRELHAGEGGPLEEAEREHRLRHTLLDRDKGGQQHG